MSLRTQEFKYLRSNRKAIADVLTSPDGGSPENLDKAANVLDEELYHLVEDPQEQRNIADRAPEKLKELRVQYDTFVETVEGEAIGLPEDTPTAMTEEEIRTLEAMGYL